MSTIKKFLELNRETEKTIAVAGDVMIDEYYFISANRISPEFPIPVFLSNRPTPDLIRPGGAANVACQFKHFNAQSILYCFLKESPLNEICKALPPITTVPYFVGNYAAQIPIKRRLYYEDFPLCRWDIEAKNYGLKEDEVVSLRQTIWNEFNKNTSDITILSDYDKGFFGDDTSRWIKGVTIVDPKKGPASKWRGCTIFKPNSKEAEEMTGTKDVKQQLNILSLETKAEFVVITKGGGGIVGTALYEGDFEYTPTKPTEVNSVIGAGDCFVAMLALAYSHGMSIYSCIAVAFEAGAVYVQKKYNEPIAPYELSSHDDHVSVKFVKPQDLVDRDDIIFANGCFDFGLTKGHVVYLQEAKKFGGKLVVAINSDESIKKLKGKDRPVMSLEERKFVVASLGCVDYVMDFNEETPLELMKKINPSLVVKGGDYKAEDVVGFGLYPVKIINLVESVSTSKKIEKISPHKRA